MVLKTWKENAECKAFLYYSGGKLDKAWHELKWTLNEEGKREK